LSKSFKLHHDNIYTITNKLDNQSCMCIF
jgi:hypothetical protein